MQTGKPAVLIQKKEWVKQINSLRTGNLIKDKAQIRDGINKLLIDAVKKRVPDKKFGIMFSGGVDSTLLSFICKKLGYDFTCYSVGLDSSEDLKSAIAASSEIGFNLKHKVYSLIEAELIIKKTAKVLGKNYSNVVNVGVGAVEVACLELAKNDKIIDFFGGLGSEEIFAGYERHEKSDNINEECWSGLLNMWERDMVRDNLISSEYNVIFCTPFLDYDLIKFAMQIPDKYKIVGDSKKQILREAAIAYGLPEKYAMRPKKAAQYGSSFDKALLKIAKMSGFKYKSEYLKSLE
ncbi:MAG: asparagine synthase-related protein [archaeon]